MTNNKINCEKVMPVEKASIFTFNEFNKKAFPIMLYIGPTKEYYSEYENCIVKNLITDEVFEELSRLGVNAICGHGEEDDGDETMSQIFLLCEKYGIVYLPRYETQGFGFYDHSKKRIITYNELSDEKKEEAKNHFVNFINKYKDFPAFGGICGGDEPGIDLVPAYVELKKIFDEMCPNKLYFINMFGPDSEKQVWLKYGPFVNQAVSDNLSSPDTLTWLDVVYNYANTVGLEVMSYDNYIFYKNTIRPVLLRDIDRFRRGCYKEKPIWYCLLNGQEGEELTGQSKEEVFYQTNVSIAAGVSGFVLYPGFSPIEFSGRLQRGFYERKSGEKTEYYYWYKELFAHIHKCEKVLLNSTYKGLIKTGVNGGDISTEKLVQLEEHLEKQGTGDSVVHTSMLLDSFNQLIGVNSTKSQVIVGCYNYKGFSAIYLVNNSASINTEVVLSFSKEISVSAIENSKEIKYSPTKKILKQLAAGEGVLYVLGASIL